MPTGHLNPIYLIQVDKEGLSVLRDAASDAEFETTLHELRPRWQTKNRRLEGVMSFKASAVRRIGDCRLCCVYDTGMDVKPNHADLMAPKLAEEDTEITAKNLERLRKKRIKDLIDHIGANFTKASDFRDGRLAHLVIDEPSPA